MRTPRRGSFPRVARGSRLRDHFWIEQTSQPGAGRPLWSRRTAPINWRVASARRARDLADGPRRARAPAVRPGADLGITTPAGPVRRVSTPLMEWDGDRSGSPRLGAGSAVVAGRQVVLASHKPMIGRRSPPGWRPWVTGSTRRPSLPPPPRRPAAAGIAPADAGARDRARNDHPPGRRRRPA